MCESDFVKVVDDGRTSGVSFNEIKCVTTIWLIFWIDHASVLEQRFFCVTTTRIFFLG